MIETETLDKETRLNAANAVPIMPIRNDGSEHAIRSPQFMIVNDIAAYLLSEAKTGKKMRSEILSLVCRVSARMLEEVK